MIGFLAVFVRAFYLQHLDVDTWKKRAITRYTETQPIPAARGKILDRNGEILAVSTLEYKIGVVPNRFRPTSTKIQKLGQLLGKKPEEMGMKTSEQGSSSISFLMMDANQGSGMYFGSDCLRSPFDRYRSPGDPPYDGS